MKIQNPVLRGFHPDPSLVRTEDGYYIATSTFEWFPGVCIFHSDNLADWELVSHGLTDDSLVDMTGIDSACGIWAPNLTYCDGIFYLMYTIVYTNRSRFKDTWNFLTMAKDVRGPWSKPVFLNCSGFDPSLFHDTDGKKYLVNMTMDYRPSENRFSGIDIQEFDEKTGTLIGEPRRVYKGSKRGFTEGPNVMKHDGRYYLVCAEGGTEFGHCSVMLRSKSIWGPYEEDPDNPVISSAGKDCLLQRAGHMQVIEGKDGRFYMAHLCSRPIDGFSILGRETAIQNVEWSKDGWLKLSANDTATPEEYFDAPVTEQKPRKKLYRYDFSEGAISQDFMTLRKSFASNGISVQNGRLHIEGGCSVMSKYHQGLLARVQESFHCDFSARMSFVPRHLNHLAGLVVYYNYDNVYHLRITKDTEGRKAEVCAIVNKEMTCSEPVYLKGQSDELWLTARIREREVTFSVRYPEEEEETAVGEALDMRNISDEHIAGNGFTGSMLGVNCVDVQGDRVFAEFSEIVYREY